jgi:hypothetical protein
MSDRIRPKAPPKAPLTQPRFRGRFEPYSRTDVWARDLEVARFRREQRQRKNRAKCGARTRDGTPCQATVVFLRARCRLHGGLSTGPKTIEGKAVVAKNLPHVRGQQMDDVEK